MDLHLKGKTAVVTGGSQGLGRAIAKMLAMEGVKVMVTARNMALLESLRNEVVQAGGVEPLLLSQDFLAPDSSRVISETALSRLGWVDLLVNNTGRSRAMDVVGPEEEWAAAMMLDFDRHRQLTQKLLPHFYTGRAHKIRCTGNSPRRFW